MTKEELGKCHDCTASQTEVNMLSRHILELQADKGRLTDRVRELEAEVKEWKDKADLWCKTANLKDHNIMINKELEKENAELRNNGFTVSAMTEQQLKVALEKGEQLEKENAELKEKVNILDNCDRLGDVITEAYKDQLTKAKEIIKELMSFSVQLCDCRHTVDFEKTREEAEQFLSEVEK